MKNRVKVEISVMCQDRKKKEMHIFKSVIEIQKNSGALSQLNDFIKGYRKMGYKVISYKAREVS